MRLKAVSSAVLVAIALIVPATQPAAAAPPEPPAAVGATSSTRLSIVPAKSKKPRATVSGTYVVLASGEIRVTALSNAKKVALTYRTSKNRKKSTSTIIRKGKGTKVLAKGSHAIFARANATKKLRSSVRVAVNPQVSATPVDSTPQPPATGVISMTAGAEHSCLVDASGTAWCWGGQGPQEIGTNSSSSTLTPSPVNAAGDRVFSTLAAGDMHTCGLDTSAKAWCWGYSLERHALGSASVNGQATAAVAVDGGHSFRQIVSGSWHTCGLDINGSAWCWGGDNVYGQLGDGSTTGHVTPVPVAGGHTFIYLAAGSVNTCGLDTSGAAWCWGKGYFGAIGDGNALDRSTPTAVAGGHTFSKLAVGSHACGIDTGGVAWCWGNNSAGQLGDGTTTNRFTPVTVPSGLAFATLVVGGSNTCGIDTGGAGWCWGSNYYGQVGDGTQDQKVSPVRVIGGHDFTTLTLGQSHTCGVDRDAMAWCWGNNRFGQRGDGTIVYSDGVIGLATPGVVASGRVWR